MSCQETHELFDGYVDSELDVATTLQLERHLKECSSCRALLQQYKNFTNNVQASLPRFAAPAGLEDKIRAQLGSNRPTLGRAKTGLFQDWRNWAIAASMIWVLVLTAALLNSLHNNSSESALADQVVSSHVRSLMLNHISDVVSTDQHTVKPWFSGKLDFSPAVRDFSPQGFPLVGGRLDYLADRPVAALVYKRRQHTINLFIWPSQDPNSSPQSLTIKGFNLVHWRTAHMTYWAIADLNAAELKAFALDLRQADLRQADLP